jgi:L-fuconolactonase
VWCKLSGLVTEADWAAWTTADLVPYIREAVDRFGVSRLLFGSDWPVCELAASYGQVLNAARQALSDLDLPEISQIFGPNALAAYRLPVGRAASQQLPSR